MMVDTTAEREIVVTRLLNAPRELVFAGATRGKFGEIVNDLGRRFDGQEQIEQPAHERFSVARRVAQVGKRGALVERELALVAAAAGHQLADKVRA